MTSLQELSCIFCKESFEDKETLQIHFRKHGDPKFNQTAKAKVRIQSESPTSSETSKDDNEMVSCDVCSEVFPTISKAITHKHKVHPDHDAKYFCPWCGKLFTLKHLYNKHLETSHDSIKTEATHCFHCDCCNVDFFIPSAMVYHNKFFHRQDRDIPTVGYSKKVKFLCQELVQIYYCPFCGEEYDNKVNLHKHMTDDHNDENQSPEDVLRCPLCEAIFYHLDAYEVHLTFHSSDDLYSEENDMLKQIIEFSLDTVPPLMEKLEASAIDGENEDLNSMGIDQFLQLTMTKEPEEQVEHSEKVRSKKHKKHKKSKKAITLDEFLNMNTDVFGEGLNFQGVEEVPTRVVTKQLKPKKEHGLKNCQKKVPLPSEINKLQKQGIIIKRKTEKKMAPLKLCHSSSFSKPTSINPNAISTSSEVLSKLMNQSNSQIKVVKKTATNNSNVDLSTNEKKVVNTPIDVSQENKDLVQETHLNIEPNDKINITENMQDSDPNDSDVRRDDVKESRCKIKGLPETTENSFNESINKTIDDKLDTECMNKNEKAASSINVINQHVEGQTLNDFEEDLATTKILRNNLSENINVAQQSIEGNEINNENIETTVQQKPQEVPNNTLDVIKHLSHLITVKSVNHFSSVPSRNDNSLNHTGQDNFKESQLELDNEDIKDDNEEKCLELELNKSDIEEEPIPRTLNTLKNFSKHVTIKPVASRVLSPHSIDKFCDENDEAGNMTDPESLDLLNKNLSKNIIGKKVINLKIHNQQESSAKNRQESPSHQIIKKNFRKLDNELAPNLLDESNKINTKNTEILKRLTNVTAKHIPKKFQINQQTVQSSAHLLSTQKGNYTEKIIKQEKSNDDEIEIFNIDDSDSDSQDKQDANSDNESPKSSRQYINKITYSNTAPRSQEGLQNLGKNTIVKSKNQRLIKQRNNKDEENFPEQNAPFSDEDENIEQTEKIMNNSVNKLIKHNNEDLQATLKNLGKHITIKSKNLLPNLHSRENHDIKIQNVGMHGYDSGSDSDYAIGKVKVTEVTDSALSENDYWSDEDEKKLDKNILVKSPTATDSDADDEHIDEENNESFSDVENNSSHSKIKIKSLEKPCQSIKSNLQSNECQLSSIDNIKKFNREITIKSLNANKINDTNSEEEHSTMDSGSTCNKELGKSISSNIAKYNITENQTTLSTIGDKAESTTNQFNTINKEVSVKTFQTQTVIEEITTTVTKTIRTVNQTVNREVKSTNQTCTVPSFKHQKIANFNQPNRIIKNLTVRHPAPSIGTKIKNANSVNNTSIRPSNQVVPVRTGVSSTRTGSSARPVASSSPKPAKQPPVIGRALKISPLAQQSMKRSSTESTGQFTCFKKPKEFSTEITSHKTEPDGEATMHFSATQSKSDCTSKVKNIKGKSVVTSTQIKSEMCRSTNLNRIGNISGLKVVKTSSKVAAQVEERIENSGAKRAMEALEKLQKQGLLIKRPRPEDNEENFSNSDSENEEELC
ncbi:myb-like protein X [Battus philenor]|uniref:myb-like protein X n=1 Tax=Battus philenor TaxID=42288 RepID=UPI0035D06E5B